jgi:SHS2 domain-containing protein
MSSGHETNTADLFNVLTPNSSSRSFFNENSYALTKRLLMAENGLLKPTEHQPPPPFEEIEHTADNALKIFGTNLAELLINAALGMNSLMAAPATEVTRSEKKCIELQAVDSESLLVEWLSELAFWAETESLVFDEIELQNVSSNRLTAIIRGRPVDRIENPIKAVTYHNLKIVSNAEGLTAVVVFDV